jgi:hypothetical protein
VGNSTRVKVVKNKVAPPFRQVEFDIMYGEGISKRGELIDLGVKAGVVEKSGSWYSFADQRIGQGRENAKTFLKDNPDVAFQIEDKIRAAHGLDFAMSADDPSRRPKADLLMRAGGCHSPGACSRATAITRFGTPGLWSRASRAPPRAPEGDHGRTPTFPRAAWTDGHALAP